MHAQKTQAENLLSRTSLLLGRAKWGPPPLAKTILLEIPKSPTLVLKPQAPQLFISADLAFRLAIRFGISLGYSIWHIVLFHCVGPESSQNDSQTTHRLIRPGGRQRVDLKVWGELEIPFKKFLDANCCSGAGETGLAGRAESPEQSHVTRESHHFES